MKKILRLMLCVVMAALPLSGLAAADGSTAAWGCVQDQTAIVYLLNADSNSTLTCQIGTTAVDVGAQSAITDRSSPMETVIALDNSISIATNQRTQVAEILEDLVANRLEGEKFTLVTISDEVTYVCDGVEDYQALKTAIKGLQYQDQNTQLTDGLYQVLEQMYQKDPSVFRRVVLIADGVDNKQVGHTKEELDSLIKTTGYPVYTIGCTNVYGGSVDETQNLFSLSRVTSGSSFTLAEVEDTMTIVNAIDEWNHATCLEINLPDEVCDGSSKMIQISGGSQTYTVQVTVPFRQVDSTPEPQEPANVTNVTEVTEVKTDNTFGIIALVSLIAVVLIAIIAIVVILLVRKRKRETDFAHREDGNDDDDITMVDDDDDDVTQVGGAVDIFGSGRTVRSLILCDASNYNRRFEAPIKGTVVIGRKRDKCKIVIPDKSVSRTQCEVFEKDDRVMIRNLSGSSCTAVNGQNVTGETELVTGSSIKMGDVIMNVEIRES